MKELSRRDLCRAAATVGVVGLGASMVSSKATADEQLIGSSSLLPEVEAKVDNILTEKREASTWHSGSCSCGPRSSDLVMKCTGWNFSRDVPRQVLCQARQNSNLDHGWSDQFSIQVIETSRTFVRFRVRRMDDGTGSSGWGQDLRVDILVID